jgi:Polysaccharide deacetylase
MRAPRGTPFDERGGRLRGLVDLIAGHYPPFLFGLPVGGLLPVFHFHEETPETLDPAFAYLAENGYRAVVSEDLEGLVREGRHPGPRTVMLAFDDAWASLWFVVGPLLEKYDLRAVSYAIPWRLKDAPAPRERTALPGAFHGVDRGEYPFVTWPELRALASSGRVDVQSHTWTHSMIFTGDRPVGAVDATFGSEDPLARPRTDGGDAPAFLDADRHGYPLFARRSRMSDALRFFPDPEACLAFQAKWRVDARGPGAAPSPVPGRWETAAERAASIESELVNGRDLLSGRLGTPVRHVCLPWGVTSATTQAMLERLGFQTAFANRLRGRLGVGAGDAPFFLKRLHSRHIFALPGRGRRVMVTFG